jgi:hypothetical protein
MFPRFQRSDLLWSFSVPRRMHQSIRATLLTTARCMQLWLSTLTRSLDIRFAASRIVVLTQTCDLANQKTTRVCAARVVLAQEMVDRRIVKEADIRGPIRSGRVYGFYYLPKDAELGLPEAIVDLRQLHTVRLDLLQALIRNGKRRARIQPLYREHLCRHL